MRVIKRDGSEVAFDLAKIIAAIEAANRDVKESGRISDDNVASVAVKVERKCDALGRPISVEEIQDIVEDTLMQDGFYELAKSYCVYRSMRTRIREMGSELMKTVNEIIESDAKKSNKKRENANIDGNTAMGTMLQIGSACSRSYYENYLLRPEQAKAHKDGDIHIHDFDFYGLTATCCQIDIQKLFRDGFSTGHGFLREPQTIQSYAALAAIAIQGNQNDMHGGQSIPNFDYGMAEGVAKSYVRNFRQKLSEAVSEQLSIDDGTEIADKALSSLEKTPTLAEDPSFDDALARALVEIDDAHGLVERVRKRATTQTDRDTYQAMESFVHNLNTMHSRAGAQVPFSSVNYGTDTTPEGRMVIKNILLALDAGLGHGETCIFPIHIFKVKEGINYYPEDPNYDLFHLCCEVSARRLFPNYVFIDSPFNLRYYKPGHPETEVVAMGCRTRVMGNVHDPTREIAYSRGNLSFTTINLPRLAIESHGDEALFYSKLDQMLELVSRQLMDRFEIQAKKCVRNYPFLMGQGVWLDSEKLGPDDSVRDVLKHGTLSIGFIGLAETLTALYGRHHGEGEDIQKKGLSIIRHMREFCDRKTNELQMNFSLLATPAEGLSGRFVRMDRERYGEITGVTDRDYYTNSFHIPVWYPITAFEKIRLEAPYHEMCNAGHISYVELDGDTANNVEAFEGIVRYMHDCNMGYGSINHPVDRDPVCGYVGVIGDTCPRCGRHEGEAIPDEKIKELKRKYPYLHMPQGIQ